MELSHVLVLYHDVAVLAGTGIACALVAAWSILAEIRRHRRKRIDAVGCMPWTAIHFIALMGACVFLGLAVRDWLAG